MTDLILMCLGAGGAGFIVGYLLVRWADRPVHYERAPHEFVLPAPLPPVTPLADSVNITTVVPGKPEYKDSTNDRR